MHAITLKITSSRENYAINELNDLFKKLNEQYSNSIAQQISAYIILDNT